VLFSNKSFYCFLNQKIIIKMKRTKIAAALTAFLIALSAALAPHANAFGLKKDTAAVSETACAPIQCPGGTVFCGYVPGHCGDSVFTLYKTN
jgi:hypothetical protein